MRPEDAWRIVAGPWWLNGVRIGTAAVVPALLDLRSAVVVMAAVAVVSIVVGGLRRRTMPIWRQDLGYPIVYFFSPGIVVPIAVYTVILMSLTGAVALAAIWAAG